MIDHVGTNRFYTAPDGALWRIRDLIRVGPERTCLAMSPHDKAVARYFTRHDGQELIEVRRYRFKGDECRWIDESHLVAQLAASEPRPHTAELL